MNNPIEFICEVFDAVADCNWQEVGALVFMIVSLFLLTFLGW